MKLKVICNDEQDLRSQIQNQGNSYSDTKQNYKVKKQYNFQLLACNFIFCLMLINTTYADTGDELIVTGDIVNFRAAPSIDAEVLIKLEKDNKVIEIQHMDDWIEVNTQLNDIKTGWIHESLVTRETAEQDTTSLKRFEQFKQHFDDQNEVINKQNGVVHFSDTNFKNEWSIEVIATQAWLNADLKQQQDTLSVIFKLWSDAVPAGSSVSVQVIDEQDNQHMLMMR